MKCAQNNHPTRLFRPMKFAQNNNPTFLFGINEYTRLLGTWEYVPISILRALFDLLITHLYIGRQLCGQQLWLCSVKPSVMTKSRGTRKWRTNAGAAARPTAAAGIAEAGFCLLSMYTTAWQGMYYVQRIIDYHKRPHYIRPRGGSKPGRPSCQKNLYHERS